MTLLLFYRTLMCHIELVARQNGLDGEWLVNDPHLQKPGELPEYAVTRREH